MPRSKARPRTAARRSPEQEVLETLRRAYKNRDAALLASVYADDVEYTVVNRNNPPAKRLVLRGRGAVQKLFEDICSREMTHQLVRTMAGEGSIAYSVLCQYPDGAQVVGLYMSTVRNGHIVNEFSVDCWDE